MHSTINVSQETRNKLNKLKYEKGLNSIEALILKWINEEKKKGREE